MSNVASSDRILQTIRGLHASHWSSNAQVLATYASMQSTSWSLGLLDSINDPNLRDQIAGLSSKQDLPNPFFEMPILDAAVKFLADEKIEFIYLSERIGGLERLKLIFPVKRQKTKFLRIPVLRAWSHEYAPISLPLVDNRTIEQTMNAFRHCLENTDGNDPIALWFDDLPTDSKFCSSLFNNSGLSERVLRISVASRAAYKRPKGQTYDEAHVSGKRRQRLRVAMQRLEEHGCVTFKCSQTSDDVDVMLKNMMRLENSGWKNDRGTALLQNENVTKFTESSVLAMAGQGQCEIYSLALDDKILASLILFNSNGHYYPWKIAYDENFADYSVGNLLVNHVNQVLSLKPDFQFLDSLAAPKNETANRFWPDKREICTLIIGIGNGGQSLASDLMEELRSIRRIKQIVKKAHIKIQEKLSRFG